MVYHEGVIGVTMCKLPGCYTRTPGIEHDQRPRMTDPSCRPSQLASRPLKTASLVNEETLSASIYGEQSPDAAQRIEIPSTQHVLSVRTRCIIWPGRTPEGRPYRRTEIKVERIVAMIVNLGLSHYKSPDSESADH